MKEDLRDVNGFQATSSAYLRDTDSADIIALCTTSNAVSTPLTTVTSLEEHWNLRVQSGTVGMRGVIWGNIRVGNLFPDEADCGAFNIQSLCVDRLTVVDSSL